VILKVAGGVAAALLLTGCAHGSTDGSSRAALGFATAVASRDGGAACTLLAPATRAALESSQKQPCEKAVLGADLPSSRSVRRAEQYGGESLVVLDKDTVFVSRFSIGWRVVAAGCKDRGLKLPYDCQLSGE